MSKRFIPIFWGILLLFCCLTPVFGNEVPKEVLEAAEGIKEFAQRVITENNYTHLGLFNLYDKERIEVGDGYQLNYISDKDIAKASDSTNLNNIIYPSKKWYFEAVIKGEFVFMFTVDLNEGKWEVVSIGHRNLLEKIRSLREKLDNRNSSEPFILCKSLIKQTYFYNLPYRGSKNLTELKVFPINRKKSLPLNTIKEVSNSLYK